MDLTVNAHGAHRDAKLSLSLTSRQCCYAAYRTANFTQMNFEVKGPKTIAYIQFYTQGIPQNKWCLSRIHEYTSI